jgi:hypothetical protein
VDLATQPERRPKKTFGGSRVIWNESSGPCTPAQIYRHPTGVRRLPQVRGFGNVRGKRAHVPNSADYSPVRSGAAIEREGAISVPLLADCSVLATSRRTSACLCACRLCRRTDSARASDALPDLLKFMTKRNIALLFAFPRSISEGRREQDRRHYRSRSGRWAGHGS